MSGQNSFWLGQRIGGGSGSGLFSLQKHKTDSETTENSLQVESQTRTGCFKSLYTLRPYSEQEMSTQREKAEAEPQAPLEAEPISCNGSDKMKSWHKWPIIASQSR